MAKSCQKSCGWLWSGRHLPERPGRELHGRVQRSRRHAPGGTPWASALCAGRRWLLHRTLGGQPGYRFEPERALRFGRRGSCCYCAGEHPIDSRIKIADDGTVQTLTSRMGTGGMNVPLVMKIRSGCEGGGKGPLIQEDKSATLGCNNDQALFEPVAFGISSDQSKAMLSSNPHAGIYKARTSRTLDTSGGNPGCNQGGIAPWFTL